MDPPVVVVHSTERTKVTKHATSLESDVVRQARGRQRRKTKTKDEGRGGGHSKKGINFKLWETYEPCVRTEEYWDLYIGIFKWIMRTKQKLGTFARNWDVCQRSDHAGAARNCFQEDGAVDDLVLVDLAKAVSGERVKAPSSSLDSYIREAIAGISWTNVLLTNGKLR